MESDLWTTIGEIAEVFDGPHATPKKIDYGPFFLSISSLREGKLDLSQSAHLSEEEFVKWTRRVTPAAGDVLFSYETRLGEAALMPPNVTACLGRRMGLLRPKKEKVSPRYLLYAYLSPSFQSEIKVRTINGCTVDRLPLKDLPSFPIRIPLLPEQKAIAHVLGALDERIELNRRMNETLEAMAQALFKSWFVDFDPVIDNALASGKEIPAVLSDRAAVRAALGDKRQPLPAEIRTLFPDEFTDSTELGWIPKGWEVKTFDQFVELIGGGTPKTSVEEYWGGDIPWFSVVDAPSPANVFVIDTEKHVTQLGVDNSSTKILPIGTTIISARGTVGKCAIVGRPMAMNQSCYGVRGKKGIADFFVYYSIREQVEHLQRGGHGSVFNTITRDTFKIIKMAIGKTEFTQRFEACIKPFFDKILANNIQNVDLTKLRDTLLPKLLSGELRIPDAEKMVEGLEV